MTIEDWVEVTWCDCGHKFIEPYRPRPNSIFGSKIKCPKCKREFIVTYSILRDKDATDGLLESLTHEAYQPRQTTLEEYV